MIPLPQDFVEEIDTFSLPQDERQQLVDAINSEYFPTSVRYNPKKTKRCMPFDEVEKVEWCGDGRYLTHRPSFTYDPNFWAGVYYPQEASSMIVGEIVKQINPQRVLDLCASPGGKSTHIASNISESSLLVSNEVISNRAKVLTENIKRWGTGNVVVTSVDARMLSKMGGYFDMIVADVPCSGEGMFRKDPKSRSEWSLDSVKLCASRGRRILSDVWNALSPDGYLLYSTCTYNVDEDEHNVEFICQELGAELIEMDYIMPNGIVKTGSGYHFYPHRLKGEGFFIAVLKKTSLNIDVYSANRSLTMKKVSGSDFSILDGFVGNMGHEFYLIGDSFYGYQNSIIEELRYIGSYLPILYSGVQMGKIVAGKLKPSQALATYCNMVPPDVSELEYDDAIRYLKCETLSPSNFVNGLSVVQYKGNSIGWANTLPNRVNNLYPSNLRILK